MLGETSPYAIRRRELIFPGFTLHPTHSVPMTQMPLNPSTLNII